MEFVFGKIEVFARPQHVFDDSNKVKSGKQYGRIKLSDDKSIALFDVEVAESINIERNRQGLRDIAAKYIDQNITHGAIVFYHSKKQSNYRFSFIAKWSDIDLDSGELQKGETQKKRFTYLLGEQQSGATAAKRLLELANKKPSISMKDVTHAFSVEVLNKEFFKKYKEHYEKFWRYIDENSAYRKLFVDKNIDDQDLQKTIRDFAKKMLGRIVFLHFLQKKGWLGCPVLPTKKQNDEIWEDGENNFMCNLFEEYAHQDKFYSECLTELFYNTLNQPDRKNNVFSVTGTRVPYLNGGLFDNDQPGTEKMNFPKEYYGDLFDFFAQYNFTIDENSPDEQEVGIDPEMLGHIFENLLEENRERGAFYTPKEIVQYMCQESLVQYLHNHLPQDAEVDPFIRDQQVSRYLRVRENAIRLNALLDEVKVCDPAIGSGAFPIGILQEIYKAKLHIFPYLKTMENFDHGETKKKIIENSIYGVDLEHGAVEIARLRFWLALVVDEDKPHPLPNLDYKIMQGNSLLEKFEGVDLSVVGNSKNDLQIYEPAKDLFGNVIQSQLKMTFTRSETVEEIQNLIKKYFNERNPLKKADKKKQIEQKVHEHIDYNLELRENQLSRWINEAGDFDRVSRKDKSRLEEMKKEVITFEKKRRSLHRIQKTEEKPYFIWHLFFKDVFDNGGFDIVIGNPPYIQLQKLGKDTDILESEKFETFARNGDIFCLFYEQGFKILKSQGVLTFITSSKWMKGGYGKSLRKFLLKRNSLKLINLGPGIFQSATVDTNIYIGKNESSKNKATGLTLEGTFNSIALDESNFIALTSISEDAWIILDIEEAKINEAFTKKGKPLSSWDVKINFGIKTGFNEAYIISTQEKDELLNEHSGSSELIKPLARGRDINRYLVERSDQWIIIVKYGANKHLKRDYPAIYKHLLYYQEQLSARGQCTNRNGEGQHHWLELDNNPPDAYLLQFATEKLVWKRVGSIMRFAYSDEEMYCLDSTCIATGEKIKYLTAILNSKVGLYQLVKTSPQTGTGDQIISVQALEPLLVHYPSDETEEKFNRLVDIILFIRKSSRNLLDAITNEELSMEFEKIVDQMAFELYFEDHMKEIEIDVLQLVRFKDIKEIKGQQAKKDFVLKLYYDLQQKDNKIRNRILVAENRSWIIKRINQTLS